MEMRRTVVQEQARAIRQELRGGTLGFRRLVAVAIHMKHVQMPIVVEISHATGPAPRAATHAARFGAIDELTITIFVQAIARFEHVAKGRVGADVGHEPIQIEIAVDVAERRAHSVLVGEHVAIHGFEHSPGSSCRVGERARRAEVAGDEHFGVAVVT